MLFNVLLFLLNFNRSFKFFQHQSQFHAAFLELCFFVMFLSYMHNEKFGRSLPLLYQRQENLMQCRPKFLNLIEDHQESDTEWRILKNTEVYVDSESSITFCTSQCEKGNESQFSRSCHLTWCQFYVYPTHLAVSEGYFLI